MKPGTEAFEPDTIDLQIIAILQEHGRIPLVKLGEQVGLSAPSVIERVKKLEDGGVITGYHASVDARQMGKDVTAFIGVSISHPRTIATFEERVDQHRRSARMPSRHGRTYGVAEGQNLQHRDFRGIDQDDPGYRRGDADGNDGGVVDAYGAHADFGQDEQGIERRRQWQTHPPRCRQRRSLRQLEGTMMHPYHSLPPPPGSLRSESRARLVRHRFRGQHQGREIARDS